MTVKEKLAALREQMKKVGVSAYVVYDSDEHMSEYMPEYYRERRFISGFTGSAGIVVVTMKQSGLWTDGRYYIQAEKQLSGSEIKLYRAADVGVVSVEKFVADNISEGDAIGVNGKVISIRQLQQLTDSCANKNAVVRTDLDLIADIWTEDRDALPNGKAVLHSEEFCGMSAAKKLAAVRGLMAEKKLDYYVVGALDSVNWLMNIRGSDVKISPLFTSFALVGTETATLYADETRVPEEVMAYLTSNGINLAPYNRIYEDLRVLPSRATVGVDRRTVNAAIYDIMTTRVDRVFIDDFCEKLKAVKNTTETNQLKVTHKHDGVAMVRFLIWLENNLHTGKLTECTVCDTLLDLRGKQPNNKGVSFDTIAAYEANAAMMHYSPKPEACASLREYGFLLVDSGGQYLGGTTDITRTIALGTITAAQRRDFTLVLKSFIRLSSASFLEGSTGKSLDILARQIMWDNDLNYKCGTGHGVGFYLNVHEGPHNFANATVPLEEGMVITIEPGIYNEGRYGIRTENTVIVAKDRRVDSYGQFYRFEPLTLCPIDVKAIDIAMLEKKEIDWLNDYHLSVFEKLSPLLQPEEVKWLGKATQPIHA